MKAGWEIKSFAEIAEVKGGKRLPKGYSLQSIPTAHSYITVSDFTDDGTVDISRIRYISDEVFEEIKRYTISTKDLYLSIAGTIGKTGRIPPELDGANLTENACKLVFHPKINRDYVYYFTLSNDFIEQAGVHTRTAAQPKLALERLKTIKLAIPNSEAEQQRIVAILDEAFEAIAAARANAEQNRQNARALFESYLQSVFSQRGDRWVETTIGNQVDFLAGFAFKSTQYTESKDGIRLIRGDNIVQGQLRWEGVKYLPRASAENYSQFYFEENDIVLAMDRPWVAAGLKVACITNNDLPALQVQRTARLRVKPNLHWKYLFHMIRSSKFVTYLLDGQTGLGVPHISGKQILSFEFALPPLNEQQLIVQKLDALGDKTQRLESLYQRKIAVLDELKQSLLQQAFSGKL